MPSALVLTLWPSSVVFTAVLCFRIGMWWTTIHTSNRHAVAYVRRHSDADEAYPDEADYFGDDAAWLPRRPASAPDVWIEDAAADNFPEPGRDDAMDAQTTPMELPPAVAEHGRWRSHDDDTEVLPRLQDIRPPMRATPIRRPPWVDRHRRGSR